MNSGWVLGVAVSPTLPDASYSTPSASMSTDSSSGNTVVPMPRDMMETMPGNGAIGDALRGIWWWLSNPEESGRTRMAAIGI